MATTIQAPLIEMTPPSSSDDKPVHLTTSTLSDDSSNSGQKKKSKSKTNLLTSMSFKSTDSLKNASNAHSKKDSLKNSLLNLFRSSTHLDSPNPTRIVEISNPTNFHHDVHVGFDSTTGEFTGLPEEWKILLEDSGISLLDRKNRPDVSNFNVINFRLFWMF